MVFMCSAAGVQTVFLDPASGLRMRRNMARSGGAVVAIECGREGG
jgi:hypothetical protein